MIGHLEKIPYHGRFKKLNLVSCSKRKKKKKSD